MARRAFAYRGKLFLVSCLSFIFILACFGSAHYTSYDSGYAPQIFFDKEPPKENESNKMRILVVNPADGSPLTDLDLVHERKMHVFVVGSDLDTFSHTHPDDFSDGFSQQWQGIYTLNYTFPKAGDYAIAVDYTTQGSNFLGAINVNVRGNDSLKKFAYDGGHEKEFDGYDVALKAPNQIITGKETGLEYFIKKDGVEIHDLQLFLGSEIHVFVIGENLKNPDHTHSYIPGHFIHAGNMPQHYSGPTIPVHLTFREPGRYVLFGQFMHNNKIITTRFMVEVKPSNYYTQNKILTYLGYFLAILVLVFVGFMHYQNYFKKRK